jgi:molybdate transport system substrate-binding protein
MTKKWLSSGLHVMLFMVLILGGGAISTISASETFVIFGSPSMADLLMSLGTAFEAKQPDVRVRIHQGSGLELRQMIATMENRDRTKYFIGSGPIHIVAPGGDELITRLTWRYYVLPESRTAYATESLVLVVPEQLVDAPSSFESLVEDSRLRIAVADPKLTVLGQKTDEFLHALAGGRTNWADRLDVAPDARGVLDHLLYGNADVAIVFSPDAAREARRVRVTAVAPEQFDRPVIHSMVMERFCPNRPLCEAFLAFVRTPEAEGIIKGHGYGLPKQQGG